MKESNSQGVYCGIDISKSSFDVHYNGESFVFENSVKGFKGLLKVLDGDSHCVMEATGPYYLRLAVFLDSHQVKVSVVNPLVIKRFSQMRMIRAKTDKADAKLIALYAEKETPKLWVLPNPILHQIQQEQTVLEGISKQSRMLKNQLEAVTVQHIHSVEVIKTLKLLIKKVDKQIDFLETSILTKAQQHFKPELELLTSIPGIGSKTAIALLVSTGCFSKFGSSKQLASYIGICPRIFQSGTSIKGKGHITKMGASRIRTLLYMGAWSAKRFNHSCKNLYDRLLEKGKAKKLALIAVANKLLRQAFAVVTKNKMYNQTEYYSPNNQSLI